MSSFSPQTLWKRFTDAIATPPEEAAPSPGETFDEVMARIRELSATLPPRTLRVIDPDLYERGIRTLSEADLLEFAGELNGESDIELSLARAKEIASEQFAVLDPINLLSFPYPEIRSILVGRFGPNSVTERLQDLYQLESNENVKGVIIEAMHARLHWKEVNPRERHHLLGYALDVVQHGYFNGGSVIAARAAFYLLAEQRPEVLPMPLQKGYRDLKDLAINELAPIDRIGVVRILGPRIQPTELLQLVVDERNQLALETLLEECHDRWGNGFIPTEETVLEDTQRGFWRSLGAVMIHRLGLSEVPRESLRVALEASFTGEPRWRLLLRTLALVALEEGSGPDLP